MKTSRLAFFGPVLAAMAVAFAVAAGTAGAEEAVFHGRVYDATSGWAATVAGATVELRVAGTKPGAVAVSGGDGRYTMAYAVDDDDWLFFDVTAAGCYPSGSGNYHGSELHGGGALSFAVQPRADVEVRVHVYDAGAGPGVGIAGAMVGFWQESTRYDLTTDADGGATFTLMIADSESLPLWVSAAGYYTSLTDHSGAELRRTGTLEIPLRAAPARVDSVITGLVYDAAFGRRAVIADAEVSWEYYGGGVFPNTQGVVRTGADGRYRITLPLGPSDGVSLRADAAGFGGLRSGIGFADAQAGTPVDFGLPALGGVVRVEPAQVELHCDGSFTVSITNDGPPGEILTIVGLSFQFDYGQGVYGRDFVADLSGIQFPAFLASGEHLTFPMSYGRGQYASRVFVEVLSGANSGGGAVYFGDGTQCQACHGDCDGDGIVTISELMRGVALAFDLGADAPCAALNADADPAVSVAELVAAIGNALRGCEAAGGP